MKGKISEHRSEGSNQIAKERLKLMVDAAPIETSPVAARRMKKEISDIIARYYEIAPEDYEIRVVLKQNAEKSIRC
jgi:septum formation topological specificity factor MinE